MSLRNWIRNQLTASRGNEAAWEDLAVSIVDTIEAHAESYIEKLKARPSLYEMDKESLSEDFKELLRYSHLERLKTTIYRTLLCSVGMKFTSSEPFTR